jgi:hypothetical protein
MNFAQPSMGMDRALAFENIQIEVYLQKALGNALLQQTSPFAQDGRRGPSGGAADRGA